jgi:hypothetical protein
MVVLDGQTADTRNIHASHSMRMTDLAGAPQQKR